MRRRPTQIMPRNLRTLNCEIDEERPHSATAAKGYCPPPGLVGSPAPVRATKRSIGSGRGELLVAG